MNSFVNEGMLWYQYVVGRQTQQRQETECEINDYPLLRKMPPACLGVDFWMMDVEFCITKKEKKNNSTIQ